MKLLQIWLLGSLALLDPALAAPVSAPQLPPSYRPDVDQFSASVQVAKWQAEYNAKVLAELAGRKSGTCTLKNLQYRREWSTLSPQDRIAYTNAVKCVQSKPAISPKDKVPGARTHFDDFVATHLMQSGKIHFSGLFFHWHRYYTWLYEKTLRDECGYKGTQPYWDWTKTYKDPARSAVFDGSPASMGSNGKFIPHGPLNVTAFGISYPDPPGTGGGCVESGPFKDLVVNIGPVAYDPLGPDGGLGANPRCLKRDLNLFWANQTKPTDVVSLFAESGGDLGSFDNNTEKLSGVHAGGHFTIGGDPGTDPYVSPGDPVFYLHHSQIDRIWTLWQSRDFAKRTNQVYGTSTTFNVPPSPPVTLDTMMDYAFIDKQQRVGDLVSAIDGPFCYIYI